MFNDEKRKSASFIFEKMKKIYPTFQTPDEITVGEWIGVLEGYSQTEILEALKNYRKNIPYDKAPTPADFKKFLHHSEDIKSQISEAAQPVAPAEQLMNRDIELKRCRHNLYIYKQAVDYVLSEVLLQEIPAGIWRKMKFSAKYEAAKNKGLFENFDEVLKLVCRERTGKDYEFDSEAMIEAQKANRNFDVNKAASKLGETWKSAWWHD